jgi:hypothetical protein
MALKTLAVVVQHVSQVHNEAVTVEIVPRAVVDSDTAGAGAGTAVAVVVIRGYPELVLARTPQGHGVVYHEQQPAQVVPLLE